MARRGRVSLLVLTALAVLAQPSVDQARAATGINRADKAAVVAAYKERLLPALNTPAAWTGSVAACDPGEETAASRKATMGAVNYYREMVGLGTVTDYAPWNVKAQEAALMFDRNNALSHFPSSSWECHTAGGEHAAGKSNIALGVAGANAIAAYMKDYGDNNTAVGHRRWIIYPPSTRMGTGSTPRANSLYVIDDEPGFGPRPAGVEWVAWPPADYVPWEVIPHNDGKQLFRWSLSSNAMPNADFSAATVSMKFGSESLVVEPEWLENGAGDNTLVWNARRANNGRFPIEGDATFTVDVTGIKNGGATLDPYQYVVNAVRAIPDRTAPPAPGFAIPTGRLGSAIVDWHNDPRVSDLRGVEVRMAKGGTAPSRTTGTRVCKVLLPATRCIAKGLTPGARYSFGLFSFDYAGNHSAKASPAPYVWGASVTSAINRTKVRSGGTVKITGTLYHDRAGNVILSSKPVVLQYRHRKADGTWGTWTSNGTAVTGSSGTSWGDYSFSRVVKRATQYRVVFRGEKWRTGAVSAVRGVTIG